MTTNEQQKKVKEFVKNWSGECKEDGKTAPFWLSLLRDVFGVENPEQYIRFEDTCKHEEKGNALYVDAWIPSVRVMIEQKASGVALDKPYKRHGRTFQSVYEQAFEYDQTLPVSQRSKYIIACNFHEFWIYDMDMPESKRKPLVLLLSEMPEHFHQLDFLIDAKAKPSDIEEVKVSVKAGELVGSLYDAFMEEYRKYGKPSERDFHQLNVLCVRIVFCLYAEDSGLFGRRDAFLKYMEGWKWENAQDALQKLFRVLDTPVEQRSRFLDEKLTGFPYVNGGLFHDEMLDIPPITEKIYRIITEDMSRRFDWSVISPTIFGAVFESTLNPETRRSGGMHYTSIANIHNVIDPLFLDDLKKEFEKIILVPDCEKYMSRRRETTLRYDYREKLDAFHRKLASLSFLDPACGSGNFLTETFLSLRRLENRLIAEMTGGQQILGDMANPIRVSIRQFYGIEINDFAVTVAKTALWIAESQMMKETEDIIQMNLDFLPLKTNAFIHEGNALRMDWAAVIPPEKLSYIMGNPPFNGAMFMKEKRGDVVAAFPECEKPGEIDYVSGWYVKAARYITSTNIRVAFVSTNSICQGQSVELLWKPLFNTFGVKIDFAYRSFVWDSEAEKKAHVHVVIVGFSRKEWVTSPTLYWSDKHESVSFINAYLTDGANVFVNSRSKPLADIPEIRFGNMPRDGGFFSLSPEEKRDIEKKEPIAKSFLRPYLGAREFLNGIERWCIWLLGASNADIRKCPSIVARVEKVRLFRLASKASATRKMAETATLFAQIAQPKGNYIAVPNTSSQRRRYIPMGFLTDYVIANNGLSIIPDATLYHFGILESNVHMAWMRTVAGRLKSDYRYSKNIVYNTFPWPTPTQAQKDRIEKSAQGILDARKNHPEDSLADLYDPRFMPQDLRRAHIENDKAVMAAYGFDWRHMKEEDCVAALMKLYQKLAGEK